MRLAFCLFKYFPYGGMQKDCLKIMQECVRRGHEVFVYTLSWEGVRPEKITVELIPRQGLTNHQQYYSFFKKVQEKIQSNIIDVVVGFNKIPDLDIYFAADPCYVERWNKKYPPILRRMGLFPSRYRQLAFFEKKVFCSSSKTEILYISEKEKNKFQKVYNTPKERFHKMPPGIEKSELKFDKINFIREEKREEFGMGFSQKVILFVGSGFKIKGLDRALLALNSLPEGILSQTIFWVVGQDKKRPYQKFIKKNKLISNVFFLQGRDDVPELMFAADCLMHPAHNETGGNVLLEAATRGLPVITTDTCGYSPYIQQANMGYVLPSPFNQKELNKTLLNVLLHPDRLSWLKRSHFFSNQADIFSLPKKCTDFIESVGEKKHALHN